MPKLSIKECISFGWKTFASRPWMFVLTSLILFLAGMIANLPRSSFIPPDRALPTSALGVIALIVSIGLSFLVTMGKTSFYLRAHDDVSGVKLSALWHPRKYWTFIRTAILGGFATIVGLILLIVPGIIIGIMVGFSLYIVIDTGASPIEALKRSARLTKGNRWRLFGLGLILLLINILGLIAMLIGLLVSLPLSSLAVVHAYRTLSKGQVAPVVAATA